MSWYESSVDQGSTARALLTTGACTLRTFSLKQLRKRSGEDCEKESELDRIQSENK